MKSCPARGMWIEIAATVLAAAMRLVMPRKGHVD